MNTEMHYSVIAKFRGLAKAMCIKMWIFSYCLDHKILWFLSSLSIPAIAALCLSMCNIPDYQTRVMPESFLGNQRKSSSIPIFHFWILNFWIILTFGYKFDKMHIVITILQISWYAVHVEGQAISPSRSTISDNRYIGVPTEYHEMNIRTSSTVFCWFEKVKMIVDINSWVISFTYKIWSVSPKRAIKIHSKTERQINFQYNPNLLNKIMRKHSRKVPAIKPLMDYYISVEAFVFGRGRATGWVNSVEHVTFCSPKAISIGG